MRYIDQLLGLEPGHVVALWPLNELSGGIAYDVSGHGFNGVINGATLGQPGIGDGQTAYGFDAINDAVNIYSASLAAASTACPAIWPARMTRVRSSPVSPLPCRQIPTGTRREAGIEAIWSSAPTTVTSAARTSERAAAVISGPMPRGSPRVTARRGRKDTGMRETWAGWPAPGRQDRMST